MKFRWYLKKQWNLGEFFKKQWKLMKIILYQWGYVGTYKIMLNYQIMLNYKKYVDL